MVRNPSSAAPSSSNERDQRVREVCQHATYLIWERDAGGVDRVAGESSFVVHFYHGSLRDDILNTRRYLWSAEEPPLPVKSADELRKVRRQASLLKNMSALGIDRSKAKAVIASEAGKRWTSLLLGSGALLLSARSGLPAGLSGVWHSATLSRQAGVRSLHEHWSKERVLEAIKRRDPWESQTTAIVRLRIFTNAAAKRVLDAYADALGSLQELADEDERVLVQGSGISFELEERFHDDIPYLELVISSHEGLPAAGVLRSWLQASLTKHRGQLARGGSHFSDEAVRLWATSALVDFAGLSNRKAMTVWDKNVATRFGISRWGTLTGLETQTSETSFSHSRTEVFAPRSDLYLTLLSRPASDT